jgi:hypothetical protein
MHGCPLRKLLGNFAEKFCNEFDGFGEEIILAQGTVPGRRAGRLAGWQRSEGA